jgi:hypothetical protein
MDLLLPALERETTSRSEFDDASAGTNTSIPSFETYGIAKRAHVSTKKCAAPVGSGALLDL